MAVAFRAIGTVKLNVGSGNMASVGLPAGHVANDILVLIVHAADNVVCSVDQSYTKKLATNGTATIRQEIWWKRDTGSEVAPTVTHAAGDMGIARIVAFSGCVTTGDPFSAGLHKANNATKTATSNDITPNANDAVLFTVTAATNTLDTSGSTQGWSTYSGTDPTFTERGDDFSGLGSHDLNGAVADGINTTGTAIGARTAVEGWSYTAAATDNIAGMFALTAGAAGSVAVIGKRVPRPVGPTARAFHMFQDMPQVPVVAGADVTIALTGVAATSAVGSLGVQIDVPLVGVSSTTAAGSLGVQHNNALTGVSSTTTAGSLAPSTAVGLTGVAATGSGGTLAPATTVALAGVAGAASVGTISPNTTIAVTGVASTLSAGAVAPETSIELSGVEVLVDPGSVVASGGDPPPAPSARRSIRYGSSRGFSQYR